MNESPLLSRRLWLGMGLAGLGLGAAAYQWRRQTARQAAALAASAANPAGPRFPEALENLKIHTLSGQPLDLAPWRGQAVFINFWAPWCPPCVKELPLIDRAVGLWKSAAPGRQAMALALQGQLAWEQQQAQLMHWRQRMLRPRGAPHPPPCLHT